MSASRSTFQPFGRLPFEIRHQIWETAVFDIQSRVCSWNDTIQDRFSSRSLDWNDPDGLVVLDSPSLRYVCQESRRVALKHSATAGWTVPGNTHPYRRYDARTDILYMNTLGRLPDLDMALETRNHGEAAESNASAAMRFRQTRHIAMPRSVLYMQNHVSWQGIQNDQEPTQSWIYELRQLFPQLDDITVAISQRDVAEHIAASGCWSRWQLPQRPCKLDAFANFEPMSEEWPEIIAVANAYHEEPLMSLYRCVERISRGFEKATSIIASTTGTPRIPAPMIAQMYQLSLGTEAGYNWEEFPTSAEVEQCTIWEQLERVDW